MVHSGKVALLAEGVDRNSDDKVIDALYCVALLAEGVDRNQPPPAPDDTPEESPSSRRAWIEILGYSSGLLLPSSRPPRGGRG